MNKKLSYYLFSFLFLGVVIYAYFFKWRTEAIYGDDLNSFVSYANLKTFSEKINQTIAFGKFRPVYGIVYSSVIELFNTDTSYFYVFNIFIQTINTFILALILNLFLRSYWWALCFSLFYGLSRFSYFNISQLLNGGVLEGLAITFFLLSLYHIIKTLINNELQPHQKSNGILWSILYANLSLYTHERYIILLPFIFIIVLLYPSLKSLSIKHKASLCLLSIGSIFINVGIKKFIFNVPFFVGTGGTNVEFSFTSAYSFFIDGLLSIIQINMGPEYLVGIPFNLLPDSSKLLVLIVVAGLFALALLYIARSLKASVILFLSRIINESALKQKPDMPQHATLCFFLCGLLLMVLVPSVITIRLEQRWLQASFIVFIIIVVILLNSVRFKNNLLKTATFTACIVLFLWNDFYYLSKGIPNIYLTSSEDLASIFKDAIDKKVIAPQTSTLYICEQKRDINTENAILWTIGNGDIFRIYQNNSKKIVFVDSVYERTASATDTTFSHFNKQTDQIIYTKGNVIDVTNEYLKDSLRTFKFE